MGQLGMTEELRAQIWRRWKQGESLSEIGRALGRPPSTIFSHLRRQGGLPLDLECAISARCICTSARRSPGALPAARRCVRSLGLCDVPPRALVGNCGATVAENATGRAAQSSLRGTAPAAPSRIGWPATYG